MQGSERADKVASITKEQLFEILQKKFWVSDQYSTHTEANGWKKWDTIGEAEREAIMKSCDGKCGKGSAHTLKRPDEKDLQTYKQDRGEEGLSINGSLTALGNIVGQVGLVAGIQDAKVRATKMGQIAWRANKLTWLLRMALEGKCKTIMIAAISPSCTEHPETLSTMRYADGIAKIPSTAVATTVKKSKEDLMKEQIEAMKKVRAASLIRFIFHS